MPDDGVMRASYRLPPCEQPNSEPVVIPSRDDSGVAPPRKNQRHWTDRVMVSRPSQCPPTLPLRRPAPGPTSTTTAGEGRGPASGGFSFRIVPHRPLRPPCPRTSSLTCQTPWQGRRTLEGVSREASPLRALDTPSSTWPAAPAEAARRRPPPTNPLPGPTGARLCLDGTGTAKS
jgi:hypothetical protein